MCLGYSSLSYCLEIDQCFKIPCIGMESRVGVFFFLPFPPFLLFPAGNKLEKLFHRMTLLKASHSENLCLGRQARTNHFSVDLQNKIKGTQKARNEFIYLQYHNLSFTWLSCTLHVLCLYGLVYDYCGICSFPAPPHPAQQGIDPMQFSIFCGTCIIFSLSNDL